MAAAIVAVTLISLTSHQAKSGHGCLNFAYSMAMGGEDVHECDAPARKLCADPKSANIFANTGVTLRSKSAVTPMATVMTIPG